MRLILTGGARSGPAPRAARSVLFRAAAEEVLFREEIEALAKVLRLTVVHVLESPPEGFEGGEGLVTPALLDRHLPEDPGGRYAYFVCGPQPMMDVVEAHLRARGVSLRAIFSERFEIV
jgi:NAD(P)H-flavin reductase